MADEPSNSPESDGNQFQATTTSAGKSEMDEFEKSKLENYDIDKAIQDLEDIIQESSQMYQQLKEIKYGYLSRTYELYSRIDLPTVLMNACRQDVIQSVPQAKNINNMDF